MIPRHNPAPQPDTAEYHHKPPAASRVSTLNPSLLFGQGFFPSARTRSYRGPLPSLDNYY
jgi:hypothetical protein